MINEIETETEIDSDLSQFDLSLKKKKKKKKITDSIDIDPQNDEKQINPFFIAMHTFAHLLIKKLCFDCGYGSSSLKERLYFSSNPESRMNGVLIYTSSGDSEGSLGGLVRQGKPEYLGRLVKNAIEDPTRLLIDL